jgi:hypothetical protein
MSVNEMEELQDGLALKARLAASRGNTAAAMASARPGVQPAAVASMRELENAIAAKSHEVSFDVPPPFSPPPVPAIPPSPPTGLSPEVRSYDTPMSDGSRDIVAPVSRSPPIAPISHGGDVEMPIYPGSSVDGPFAPATGGIEAFVAETVVAPTGVAVIMSEEEEEHLERKKQKRILCGIASCLIIAVVAVVVVVVATRGSDGAAVVGPPTIAPTSSPTVSPTLSPTTAFFSGIAECLTDISGQEALANRTSPQFQAARWLANEDLFSGETCPSQKFLQRYTLATLYFSAGGPDWEICNQQNAACTGECCHCI